MKKTIRTVLCIICVVSGIAALLAGCIYYVTNCKEKIRDTSVSPDEKYELTLMEIGEPEWPFGSASGRLILNEGNTKISETNFRLANDGCSISSNDWAVTWNEDYVEVILSGEEQFDEQLQLSFDGTTQRQTLTDETEPTATQPEVDIPQLDIAVMENRENELVFSFSIDDFIEGYNYAYGRDYLSESSSWQSITYDSAIHSDHETTLYTFSENDKIWSLPTITVYTPADSDHIQEITVNFDEHSRTEELYSLYEELCFYTIKTLLPDLTDEQITKLYSALNQLAYENVFPNEQGYSSDSVPCVLYYKDGIGLYPYFAIGEWVHLCIIPVTEETVAEFEQKGVKIHEIQ